MIREGEAEGAGNFAQGGVSGSGGSCSGKFQGDGEAENGNPAPRPKGMHRSKSLDIGVCRDSWAGRGGVFYRAGPPLLNPLRWDYGGSTHYLSIWLEHRPVS